MEQPVVDWSRLKDLAAITEVKLAHEINLIGQRLGWLVLSEAFLFNVWIAIPRSSLTGLQKELLFRIIGSVGFITAVFGLLGTGAALAVVDRLMVARDHVETRLRSLLPGSDRFALLPRLGHDREEPVRTELLGNVAAMFLPPLFVAAWAAIGVENLVAEKAAELSWCPPAVGVAVFAGLGGYVFATIWKRRRSL